MLKHLDRKKFMMCVLGLKSILSRAETPRQKEVYDVCCVLGLKSILSRAENLDRKKFMMCVVCWVSSQY